MDVIETLQQWLNEAGISQADLARKTKKTTGAISLIFSGQRKPSAELLVDIAVACGKTPEDGLRLIGLLPPIKKEDEDQELFNHLFQNLKSTTARKQAIEYIKFLTVQEEQGSYEPE